MNLLNKIISNIKTKKIKNINDLSIKITKRNYSTKYVKFKINNKTNILPVKSWFFDESGMIVIDMVNKNSNRIIRIYLNDEVTQNRFLNGIDNLFEIDDLNIIPEYSI